MEPQNQNQSTGQNVAPGEVPHHTASSSNTPEGTGPSLMPLWIFLGLLSVYILIVLMGVNGSDGGPFEGGYLLLVITLCYLPIFIVTQISAARAINRVMNFKYLTRPKPVLIRLLPLIVLAAVLLIVMALTYYNYVQTNEKLAQCPTCIQHYPFNPTWYITAATVLMLPYLLIGIKNLRK